MKLYRVTLTEEEREELEAITRKGSHASQKVINALVLLNCDEGRFQDRHMRNEEVAAVLNINFLACEPLAGKRLVKATERKTKLDWA